MSRKLPDNLPEGTVIVDKDLAVYRHPRIGYGRASVSNRWIGCIYLAGRHRAGDSIADLAYDYDITKADVRAAIAYINKRRGESGKGKENNG